MKNLQGKNLIFLISQPRSGSTLLQLLLSGHPDIATTSEPWIALHPIFALRKNDIATIYNADLARNALSDFLQQCGVKEEFYKDQVATFLLRFYNLAIEHQKKKMFLDKTPRYYHILFDLAEIFPGAKFIILFRNPLAVLNSILKTWVKEDLSRLGGFREDLISAPKMMVDFSIQQSKRIYKVKYEDLVETPEGILKDICSFLDISFSRKMLGYNNRCFEDWKFGDPIGIKKSYNLTMDSVNKWKKDFITEQERLLAISYIREIGKELVTKMGYNYDELESIIKISTEKISNSKLISWEEMMDNKDGFLAARMLREIRMLKEQRDLLMNSMSWKVTAPARSVYNVISTKKKK